MNVWFIVSTVSNAAKFSLFLLFICRSPTRKLHTDKKKLSKTKKTPPKTLPNAKKAREMSKSKRLKFDGCSTTSVVDDDQLICKSDCEVTISDNLSVGDECCSRSENVVNLNSWGQAIPELVLLHIFRFAVDSVGAIPFLNRLLIYYSLLCLLILS